jgi:hypothetical protein
MKQVTCDGGIEVFYYLPVILLERGKIMNGRLFFFLFALLATALPEAAWAGSGGPDYVNMGMLVVIIVMLFVVIKKIR